MLIIAADCKIRFLSDTYEGAVHDKRVADEANYRFPAGSILIQDLGLQGFESAEVTIIQPFKKPRGGQLSDEQKAYNAFVARLRIRIEHAIGGVKRFRIVKDKLRLWRDDVRHAIMLVCCGLHNFRLNHRPWNYPPLTL